MLSMPFFLSTAFAITLAVAILALIILTLVLVFVGISAKKSIKQGEEDFDVLDEKVGRASRSPARKGWAKAGSGRASRSPARKGWAKAGSILADIVIAVLAIGFLGLLFTRIMPSIGMPYVLEVVASPSMASVLPQNESHVREGDKPINVDDLIAVKRIDSLDEIKLYDIISYDNPDGRNYIHRVVISYDNPDGRNYIHRVVEIAESYVITQGDANNVDDGVEVTLDMIVGVYTGFQIPYIGTVTFYLQSDYGILGMSCLAYVIIAAEIYFTAIGSAREKRLKSYDDLFASTGARIVIYSDPNGTISFDKDYVGTIDESKTMPTKDITFKR